MPPSVNPAIPAKRILPSKESSLFKDLLNHYETRQLKKGQKTADQILKKFPEHGETLCMKGLILTHMGKREEGLELVKKGIRLDLTSHICWHVFGLIQKGEKNYEEALKSYTQALRFDKDNLNLLNDAANLQTHLRLYDSLQETRHAILKLRPNLRRNWVALAVAYHLNGNLPEALSVLEQYERTLKNVPDFDVEHSEVLLYHVRLLEELHRASDALVFLNSKANGRGIVDQTVILETRARLLSKIDKPEESQEAWLALIKHNPDCNDHYKGFLASKGFDLTQTQSAPEVLSELKVLADLLPLASAPLRLSLDFAIGDGFIELIIPYLKKGFSRGVPSLFVDLKTLYSNADKRKAIEEIVTSYKNELGSDSTESDESPTTYLWTLYYLAQHHSYLGDQQLALSIIDSALLHTPTLPELYTLRGRIFKRAGDPISAASSLEDARRLDGQDRFLNTKCAKYYLRAGLIEEALDILGLFTKKDAPSPGADLEDMQSFLYLLEAADAFAKHDRLGLALKKYLAVQKIFEDIHFDQYDFHSYSLRRFIVNVYLDTLHWEDELYSRPQYVQAAVEAANIYVQLYDNPKLAGTEVSLLTGSQKKSQKKVKKAAVKGQEDSKKAANASSNEDKGLEPVPIKDEDPEGVKAVSVTDPLEQAWKLIKPLLESSKPPSVAAWLAIYDVAVRQKKYLLAVRALYQIRSFDKENPELHVRLIDFKLRERGTSDQNQITEAALSEVLASLLPDVGLETYNSQYLQQHSTSAPSILASARALSILQTPVTEIDNVIFGMLVPEVVADIKICLRAISLLQSVKSSRVDEFRLACQSRFPVSTVFKSPEELAQLKAQHKRPLHDEQTTEEKSKQEIMS